MRIIKILIISIFSLLSICGNAQNFFWSHHAATFPSSYSNYCVFIMLGDPNETGDESLVYSAPGANNNASWTYPDNTFGATNPHFFTVSLKPIGSISIPDVNDVVKIKVPEATSRFDTALGHRMRYLITTTSYSSSQWATIKALSTELTDYSSDGVFYGSSFVFAISDTETNYVYFIWDFIDD